METVYLYYCLYTPHSTVPSQFALDPNHSNLSAIDANLVAPPYTVENITQYILERENSGRKAASTMVYIDHKDANPAPGGAIIDIMGASTQPSRAIRIVFPGGPGDRDSPAPIWTLTAHYTISEETVRCWLESGKYVHEHTRETVQYLPFSPGDTFTTDLVPYRLETPGWKDVWKVTKVANGKVGYVEAYEYDSRFTRTKNVGGAQKPVPW
ncbi:hypothetical protein C8J57DRAFT_1726298 [Mycena rebaudengoi]|nr:hypothetical protein C8J57DRAFT_1726298 [Mycena rebaudengoi]